MIRLLGPFGQCGTSTFNGLDRSFRNFTFVADEDPFYAKRA
jgi:hypothetical protein